MFPHGNLFGNYGFGMIFVAMAVIHFIPHQREKADQAGSRW